MASDLNNESTVASNDHENGQMKSEGNVKDKEKEWLSTRWGEDGSLNKRCLSQ
ncbi:MAG: hypothetical protein NZ820_16555 [Dehalococcoidia bacterium]|nr:hypothetical protein [Dehalococcoidia bacterium]